MSYENNNVKAGANGAGVYVGDTDVKCDVTDHVDIKASKIGGVVMMNFGEFDNSEIITYLIMK